MYFGSAAGLRPRLVRFAVFIAIMFIAAMFSGLWWRLVIGVAVVWWRSGVLGLRVFEGVHFFFELLDAQGLGGDETVA